MNPPNTNIGIIGFGFVGKAIAFGFGPIKQTPIQYSDPAYPESESLESLIKNNHFLFVCVPTPMKADSREIDPTILDSVIDNIYTIQECLADQIPNWIRPIVTIRSTVIPTVLSKYEAQYPALRLVFSMEALTERTANLDFINTARWIFGGKREDTNELEVLHRLRFLHTPIYHCDLISASLVKYMCNSFFAVKVSFMNEMYEVAQKSGTTTPWDQIVAMFLADGRIGNSHYQVPGPDGRKGWGGKCLVKDLNAFVHYAKQLRCEPNTLQAAWETNTRVRVDKDWERIIGAVSKPQSNS